MLSVAVSPSATRSRSSHARVCACANVGRQSSNSKRKRSESMVIEMSRIPWLFSFPFKEGRDGFALRMDGRSNPSPPDPPLEGEGLNQSASVFTRFLPPFVLQPELGAQQPARIVRHATQPGLVCLLLLAISGAFGALGLALDFLALLRLHVAFERALRLRALRGISVALALLIGSLRRLRGLAGLARIRARTVRGR